ncbi:MAG: WhiB family transcriptional regulator [Acidimicrobiales bacterium]
MIKHPTGQIVGEHPRELRLVVDGSLTEMHELVEISTLGAPAAKRLRAMVDSAVVDQLVEAHMQAIPDRPPPTGSPTPPTSPPPLPTTPAAAQPPAEPHRSAAGSMNTEWMARGNCADESPAVLFPSDGVGVEIARRICAGCPVREQCLEYALANRIDHGVWGGLSERERRRVLKRRRMASLTQRSAQAGSP